MINSIQYNSSNNVIPQPPQTQRGRQVIFKSAEKSTETHKKHKKKSFLHRHKGLATFFAGGILGEIIYERFVAKKIKNPTFGKEMAIGLLFELVFGLAAVKIAEEIHENRK